MEKTPLKTNMFSENQWLEDVFPTEIVPFYGTFVRFQGCFPPTSNQLENYHQLDTPNNNKNGNFQLPERNGYFHSYVSRS